MCLQANTGNSTVVVVDGRSSPRGRKMRCVTKRPSIHRTRCALCWWRSNNKASASSTAIDSIAVAIFRGQPLGWLDATENSAPPFRSVLDDQAAQRIHKAIEHLGCVFTAKSKSHNPFGPSSGITGDVRNEDALLL